MRHTIVTPWPGFLALTILALPGWMMASVIQIKPIQDTFVVNPGIASPFGNAANHNYGGSGSSSVAAAGAYAHDPTAGINHLPKGEFRGLLQFDLAELAGQSVSQISLNLYISNGNQGAFDLYNYRGHSGTVGVYLIAGDWEQGYDTPHNDTTSPGGITFNRLETLLSQSPALFLDSFYYDASNPYGSPAWFQFGLTAGNSSFDSALINGETVTLMLASLDDEVAFNYTAYAQANANPAKTIYRTTGPYLEITCAPIPEPCMAGLMGTAALAFWRKRNRPGSDSRPFQTGNQTGPA